jgi:hypothetical protein
MGLAHIIRDEQRHFLLYKEHAEHWGCSLGDVGVGPFFWKSVSSVREPADFLAAMSLTFEQANLDFAVYWKKAFSRIEDDKAVEILDQVYRDEVRHVRHGVHWFQKLKGPLSVDAHRASLHFPLSLGRAKGPLFNREGREKAGLSPEYIQEIEISNASRGRPPKVFAFRPSVETDVAGQSPKKMERTIQRDLGSLMMFLAQKEDVVLSERPPVARLQKWHQAGFAIPQFLAHREDLNERIVGEWCPWGWSPAVGQEFDTPWQPEHQKLYDKTWALQLRHRFEETHSSPALLRAPAHCHSDLEGLLQQIQQPGCWVVKRPFSTSGRGRLRLEGTPSSQEESWLKKGLQQGRLIVEPWAKRVVDWSIQVDVGPRPKLLGITRFWTHTNGNYSGALIGKWTEGISKTLLRGIHEHKMPSLLQEAALHAAKEAHLLGYSGPMGVDSMVVQTEEGLRLEAILEINPRFTMGRIALALAKRSRGVGVWLHLSQKSLEEAGYMHAEKLQERIDALPFVADSRGIHQGLLWTSSSPKASVHTLLCIEETLEKTRKTVEELGLIWPGDPRPS